MPELTQQYTLLLVLLIVTALFWLASAIGAFLSYRSYHQNTDLAWVAGFLLLALGRVVAAAVASAWGDNVASFPVSSDTLTYATSLSVSAAAIELVAAMLIFFAFRAKRRVF